MNELTPELPTDIEALQALLVAACTERDIAIAERAQALTQIDRLRHLLLQRAQFGRRSEKLDPDPLLLAIEDTEQVIASNEAMPSAWRICAAGSMISPKKVLYRSPAKRSSGLRYDREAPFGD